MRDLLIRENLYSFVPYPAEEMFEEGVFTWYFGNSEEQLTPHIFDNLLNKDPWAENFLLWLHREISEYHFAGLEQDRFFDPSIFPLEDLEDDNYDAVNDYYFENYDVNEMFFYLDMKHLLDKHHMFYLDNYAGNVIQKKTRVINPPIKGVW